METQARPRQRSRRAAKNIYDQNVPNGSSWGITHKSCRILLFSASSLMQSKLTLYSSQIWLHPKLLNWPYAWHPTFWLAALLAH